MATDYHTSHGSVDTAVTVISCKTAYKDGDVTLPAESSTFDDGACGEAFTPQHVVLDFRPRPDDDEEVTKKCYEFWEEIKKHPELSTLFADEDYGVDQHSETPSTFRCSSEATPPEPSTAKETTAVSMLDLADHLGLLERAFETKLQTSYCTIGDGSYCAKTRPVAVGVTKKKKRSPCICARPSTCSKHCVRNKREPPSDLEVQKMNVHMDRWDEMHPKSMDPPGHPPPLSKCVLQRNYETF